jgi:hypothetical protein
MTIQDLFERYEQRPLDLSGTPTDAGVARIRQRCQELVALDAAYRRAEALMESMRIRRDRLATDVIPELMDEVQTDTIGLSEAGVDIVVEPWVHASIKKDLPEEDRERMFDHLAELGGGDLPTASVTINFPKKDMDRARSFRAAAQEWLKKSYGNSEPPRVGIEAMVHHGTLTSWLKDHLGYRRDAIADGIKLPPLRPELLGARIGRICRIRKRSSPPVSRNRRARK